MSTPAALPGLHRRALEQTRGFVAAIGDDQWHDATPCTEWDVRTLVNHIVAENLWVEALDGGATIDSVGDLLDGDILGDDPVAAYDASATASQRVFDRDGAMDQTFHLSYADAPGSLYAAHRFLDVLIHGWDVAEATGQDTTLDPDLVAACLVDVEPQADAIAASRVFGTPVPVAPGADPQTRLLALLGREARPAGFTTPRRDGR
jgi:uncharacterized protein (TIGR03086 family)